MNLIMKNIIFCLIHFQKPYLNLNEMVVNQNS